MNKLKMLKGAISVTAVIGLCLFLVKAGVSSVAIPSIQGRQIENIDKLYAGEMVNFPEPKGAQKATVKEDVKDKMEKPAGGDIDLVSPKVHAVANKAQEIVFNEYANELLTTEGNVKRLGRKTGKKTNSIFELVTLLNEEYQANIDLSDLSDNEITDLKNMQAHWKMSNTGLGQVGDIYVVSGASDTVVNHEKAESETAITEAKAAGVVTPRELLAKIEKEEGKEAANDKISSWHGVALQSAANDVSDIIVSRIGAEKKAYIEEISNRVSSLETAQRLKSLIVAIDAKRADGNNATTRDLVKVMSEIGGMVYIISPSGAISPKLKGMLSGFENAYSVAKEVPVAGDDDVVIDMTENVDSTTLLAEQALVAISLNAVIAESKLNESSVAFYRTLSTKNLVSGKANNIEELNKAMKATGTFNFDRKNKELEQAFAAWDIVIRGA